MTKNIIPPHDNKNKAMEMRREIKKKTKQLDILKKKQSEYSKEIGKIVNELEELNNMATVEDLFSTPNITDHSILRYMERIEKTDIEAYKEKILPEQLIHPNDGDYDFNTHIVRIKNNSVVTILPPKKTTFFTKLKDFIS